MKSEKLGRIPLTEVNIVSVCVTNCNDLTFQTEGGLKVEHGYCTESNYNVFLENMVLVFILFLEKCTLLIGATLFIHLIPLVFSLLN